MRSAASTAPAMASKACSRAICWICARSPRRSPARAPLDPPLCPAAVPPPSPVKLTEVVGRAPGGPPPPPPLGQAQDAAPPHLIYFPERTLDEVAFLEDVRAARERFGYV